MRRVPTLLCLLVLLVPLAAAADHHEKKKGERGEKEAVRIAKIVDGGEAKVNEKVLVKKFQDGGEIERFEVVKRDPGWYLLRIGTDAEGTGRTEAIPLALRGDWVILRHIEIIERIIVCMSMTCEGSGLQACRPNNDVTACYCSIGGDCKLTVNGIQFDHVVEVLTP